MEDGVWRTVRGRRIFIKDGQSLTEAMRDSGKFTKKTSSDKIKSKEVDKMKKKKTKSELKKEIQDDIDKLNEKIEEGFYFDDDDQQISSKSDYDDAIDKIEEYYNYERAFEPDDMNEPFDDDFGNSYNNYEEYLTSWEREKDIEIDNLKEKYSLFQDKIRDNLFEIENKINNYVNKDDRVDLIHNFNTNGTAWQAYIEAFNEQDDDQLRRMTSALQTSKYRHTQTDYDSINKRGLTDEQVAEIRRQYN